MPVEIPTHISGTMEFSNGAIGTITTSFDIWDSQLPRMEIYGTAGTLCIPDLDPLAGPNLFGGPVLIKTKETSRWRGLPRKPELQDWDELPVGHKYNENSRGLGLSDMAYAIGQMTKWPIMSLKLDMRCLSLRKPGNILIFPVAVPGPRRCPLIFL